MATEPLLIIVYVAGALIVVLVVGTLLALFFADRAMLLLKKWMRDD